MEHNLPFNCSNHLPDLLRSVCPDCKLAKKIVLGRNKCQAVIQNVIGECNSEDLLNELRSSKFSLLVDESTDTSTTKLLCLVVRRLNVNLETTDDFLTLLEVGESATA